MKRSLAVVVILALPLLAGCTGSIVSMPPVTASASALSLPGKVVWHDLITHTPEASERFYGELFGWEFEPLGIRVGAFRTINYTLIRHEGRLIGGMVDANLLRPGAGADISQWVVVMSVADIDAALIDVRAQGGTVRNGPVDLDERGRLAIVSDAQGASLALLQTRDGDPPDVPLSVGGFLWDEVWTDDADASTGFYRSVTGLQPQDGPEGASGAYRLLADGTTPRMGVLPMPLPGLAPTWVSYVRVADAYVTSGRVESLGGRTLIAAQARPVGGEAALIAGPSGAGIAIQTWSLPPAQ